MTKRMSVKLEKGLNHLIQTILAQIVDVNNHVRTTQDNKEVDEKDKIALTNFAQHHLLVLSILLHELEDYAIKKFPDAKGIIDWAANHYQFGLNNKQFTPCKCAECPQPVVTAAPEAEVAAVSQ